MIMQNVLEAQELYELAINHLSEGILLLDQESNVLMWNEAAAMITGYVLDDIRHHSGLSVLDSIDELGIAVSGRNCPVEATLRDGKERAKPIYVRHKKGYRVPVILKTTPITEEGEIVSVMAVMTDNSVQVQQDDVINSLAKLVMMDQLTGLCNRRQMEVLIGSALEERRYNRNHFSILFMNLDDFSKCNKLYGYDVGDQLLITLAERFRTICNDANMIGRWDGEEFIGLIQTQDEAEMKAKTETVRALIENTEIDYNGIKINVTASIGATMVAIHDTAQELIERAISLMHVSKISGKNCATIG